MSDEMLRLRKLIEHWAKHNDEHKVRFEESAREAAAIGLDAIAEHLKAAARGATEVSEYLLKALELFE